MTDTPASSWLPFLTIGAALCVGTMGATLISPLFPIYQSEWGLSASIIAFIYVSYMAGVLGAFLFLGHTPDHVGPINVLRAALALILLGLGMASFAADVTALILARVVTGIGSGLITTSAALGLIAFEPKRKTPVAPLVASLLTMVGFGLGPLVAGIIAQFAPFPLVTPYVFVMAPAAVIFLCLCLLKSPGCISSLKTISLRPRFVMPCRSLRPQFLLCAFTAFAAFCLFSFVASLAPSLLSDLSSWHGSAISGAAVAAILFCSAAVQVPSRQFPMETTIRAGLLVMASSVVWLAAAVTLHSGVLFAIADILIGIGHGMAFVAALTITNSLASARDRASVLSAFFCIAYLGTIVPTLALGVVVDLAGFSVAVSGFSLFFGLACLTLAVLTTRPAFSRPNVACPG